MKDVKKFLERVDFICDCYGDFSEDADVWECESMLEEIGRVMKEIEKNKLELKKEIKEQGMFRSLKQTKSRLELLTVLLDARREVAPF